MLNKKQFFTCNLKVFLATKISRIIKNYKKLLKKYNHLKKGYANFILHILLFYKTKSYYSFVYSASMTSSSFLLSEDEEEALSLLAVVCSSF